MTQDEQNSFSTYCCGIAITGRKIFSLTILKLHDTLVGVWGNAGVLCSHELWGRIVTMWDDTDISLRCHKATLTIGHKTIERGLPRQPWPQLCCVWPQTYAFCKEIAMTDWYWSMRRLLQEDMEGPLARMLLTWSEWKPEGEWLISLSRFSGLYRRATVLHPKSTYSPRAIPTSQDFRKLKAQQRKSYHQWKGFAP